MSYSAASPVFAPSRVTAAQFAAFLRAKRSPATTEASAIHAVLVGSGVDPAVALGQFAGESTFGTRGYARVTRNWGNIAMATPGTGRNLPTAIARAAFRKLVIARHWSRRFGAKPYSPGNGYTYASFPTWRDGVRAYAALLRGYPKRSTRTIEAMADRWLGGHGAGYIGNICRIANQAAGSAAVPAPTPASPPVVQTPAPAIPPISTTPEHLAAAQPPSWGYMTYGFSGEIVSGLNAWPAWVARSQTMAGYASIAGEKLPVYVLVHGGPKPLGGFDSIGNLANWLAARGAVAVTIDYPTRAEDGDWRASVSAIRLAIAAVRGKAEAWGGDPSRLTLVCHSFGGFFGELVAFTGTEADRLVLIATEDQANDIYLASVGNPPSPRALMGSSPRKVPTTVITGSADAVATVAEAQALVAALNAAGHPGRWLVIDGADHNSILSDVGTIAAVLGS